MVKYQVKVPIAQVLEARRTCATLKDGITALRSRLAQLEDVDVVKDGMAAMERAEEERQRIKADIDQAKAEAVDEIQGKAQAYSAEVDKQAALKGEDLATAPDYALIREKMITNPEQLQMMVDRNQDNYTLLTAIDRYATEKKWTGFAVVSNAPMVQTFGENWFRLCIAAANNPDGMAIMQIQTPGELRRLLQAYGVLDAAELPDDEA